VKIHVPDHVVWDRLDSYKGGANKNIDFLERLLFYEVGSLCAWSAYCLLCVIIGSVELCDLKCPCSPADQACSEGKETCVCDMFSTGLLHLLLKVCGTGKYTSGNYIYGKQAVSMKPNGIRELAAKQTPLGAAVQRMLMHYCSRWTSSFHQQSRTLIANSTLSTEKLYPATVVSRLILMSTGLFKQCRQQFISNKLDELQRTVKRPSGSQTPAARPQFVVLESAHEYENNTDQVMRIYLPGANGIEVIFDEETSTEV
jgi:hypothetical protein